MTGLLQLGEVNTHDHGRKDSRVGLDRSEDESNGDSLVGCRDSCTQYLNTPRINNGLKSGGILRARAVLQGSTPLILREITGFRGSIHFSTMDSARARSILWFYVQEYCQ